MKKIKFVVFLLNFLFSINLAVGANRLSENDVINVDGFSYIYNEGSLALCKGGKYSGEITIPETVRYEGYDYKVTGIKEGTFQSNQTITKVVMPNSILSIGDMAFFDCNGLSELSLPQNLKFIGSQAFDGCSNISGELVIPGTVKQIGNTAFSWCSNISTLIIKEGVQIIGNYAFYACGNIKKISLPQTLTSIGDDAFRECSFPTIDLPLSLKKIGERAFLNNTKLASIDIPGSVEEIGNSAFEFCENLTAIKLNEGIISIGANAFHDCYNIEEVFVPNSVTFIGESAFAPWKYGETKPQLKYLTIGNGVKNIKDITWGLNKGTTSTERIVIGSGIETLNDNNILQQGNTYLLTNNVIRLTYSWKTSPKCNLFVADSTKYSEADIKKYGIKNLTKSSSYKGEYNGKAPNISLENRLDGYTVTILPECYNVGTYTNTKVEFTDGKLTSTVSVPCDYTITKAPLKIAANDIVISYGDRIPNLGYSYIGFKNGETEEIAISTKPTVTTSAKKGSSTGTYPIRIAGAEAKNYSLSYQDGTLTIKKAHQTIEWNQSLPSVYSGDVIELEAISSCSMPISYTTSDASIAFVTNDNGKPILHILKEGTIQVTATQSGNENYEAATSVSKALTITPRSATGISLDQTSLSVKEGENFRLTAKLTPETVVEKNVKWTTSNATIATVENGVVTGIKAGKATITATTIDGSNLSASCIVTVKPILATSVSLDNTSIKMKVDEIFIFTATISPENVTNRELSWTSSNTSVATIADGIITAIKPGKTVITAKTTDGSNITATCIVTVEETKATMLLLDKTALDMFVNETAKVVATVLPSTTSNKDLVWTTSNGSVATIVNGMITAVGSGTATITAITTDGSNLSTSCVVTVKKHTQSVIWGQDFDKQSWSAPLVKLEATTSSGLRLKYISSDENIAQIVEENGIIYIKPISSGVVNITVYQQGDDCYDAVEQTKTIVITLPTQVELVEDDNRSNTFGHIVEIRAFDGTLMNTKNLNSLYMGTYIVKTIDNGKVTVNKITKK